MTVNTFVGPDGNSYSENKPDEGGFLYYFDGRMWWITFPAYQNPDQVYCFHGEHLPISAKEWRLKPVAGENPVSALIETC